MPIERKINLSKQSKWWRNLRRKRKLKWHREYLHHLEDNKKPILGVTNKKNKNT